MGMEREEAGVEVVVNKMYGCCRHPEFQVFIKYDCTGMCDVPINDEKLDFFVFSAHIQDHTQTETRAAKVFVYRHNTTDKRQ